MPTDDDLQFEKAPADDASKKRDALEHREKLLKEIRSKLVQRVEGSRTMDLLDFLDKEEVTGRTLTGFIAIHVDDGLAMGTEKFCGTTLKTVMDHFGIDKLESEKFKYLGGVLTKYGDHGI